MGAITREENTVKVAADFIGVGSNTARLHRLSLTAPVAASNTAVHAAINSNAVITTAITQPDFARNITIVGAGSGHNAAGTVTINGTDVRGVAISETLTLNGNTAVVGAKAFKTVTSIDMTAVTGNDANNTVSVGVGNKFGLTRKMDANNVLLEAVDGVQETPSAVAFSTSAICSNTVTPLTAANASHNYIITYVTNEQFPTS